MWLKWTYIYYVWFYFVVYTLMCKGQSWFRFVRDVILVFFQCWIKEMFSSCQAIDLLCYLEDRIWALFSFNINDHNKRPKEIAFWRKKEKKKKALSGPKCYLETVLKTCGWEYRLACVILVLIYTKTRTQFTAKWNSSVIDLKKKKIPLVHWT